MLWGGCNPTNPPPRSAPGLKQNNSLYSDVSIDASVINQDDCCSASDAVPTLSTDPPQFECAVVRTDFILPNVETIDVIRQGGAFHQVHQLISCPWPASKA